MLAILQFTFSHPLLSVSSSKESREVVYIKVLKQPDTYCIKNICWHMWNRHACNFKTQFLNFKLNLNIIASSKISLAYCPLGAVWFGSLAAFGLVDVTFWLPGTKQKGRNRQGLFLISSWQHMNCKQGVRDWADKYINHYITLIALTSPYCTA